MMRRQSGRHSAARTGSPSRRRAGEPWPPRGWPCVFRSLVATRKSLSDSIPKPTHHPPSVRRTSRADEVDLTERWREEARSGGAGEFRSPRSREDRRFQPRRISTAPASPDERLYAARIGAAEFPRAVDVVLRGAHKRRLPNASSRGRSTSADRHLRGRRSPMSTSGATTPPGPLLIR
jgi:hypothetical protein